MTKKISSSRLKYPNVLDGTIKLHTFARLLNTSNKHYYLFVFEENAFTFYIVEGDRKRIFAIALHFCIPLANNFQNFSLPLRNWHTILIYHHGVVITIITIVSDLDDN